jgi:Bacterial PH domain/Short C-terminal domain
VGTYAESLLSDGEVILRRERQHWLALILDARNALALWLIALVMLGAIVIFNVTGGARDILAYVALGALVLGLLLFAWRWWQWRTEEYLVTNIRLLKVSGIINKESGDSSLEKINDVVLFENLLGRMLDYGDLDILTAAEVAVDRYRMLKHAKAFKIDMLNAKHALEHEVAYVAMPSPPLKTESAAPTASAAPAPVPTPPAPVASAPAPEAARVTADATPPTTAQAAPARASAEANPVETPEEVSETLARLADLRDKGAISAEDYEAKKTELLGRL